METHLTEKERMRQYLKNWEIVSAELEREKVAYLRTLTGSQSAEIFDGMDCDPSMVWKPEERIRSSGSVEQQRIFARGHKNESSLCRCP